MSNLLTRDEYQAIAGSIDHSQEAFCGGRAQSDNGKVLPGINPATGLSDHAATESVA